LDDIKTYGVNIISEKYSEHERLFHCSSKLFSCLLFLDQYNKAFTYYGHNSVVYKWGLQRIRQVLNEKLTEASLYKMLVDDYCPNFYALFGANMITEKKYGPTVLTDVRTYFVSEDVYSLDSSICSDKCYELLNNELVQLGLVQKIPFDLYPPIPKHCYSNKKYKCHMKNCLFSTNKMNTLRMHLKRGRHGLENYSVINYQIAKKVTLLRYPVPSFDRIRYSFIDQFSGDCETRLKSITAKEAPESQCIHELPKNGKTLLVSIDEARINGIQCFDIGSKALHNLKASDIDNVVFLFKTKTNMYLYKTAKHVVSTKISRLQSYILYLSEILDCTPKFFSMVKPYITSLE
jgi:hypothetical protein